MLNRHGAVHGGVLATLLDVTLAAAIRARAPDCRAVATVNLNLQFLRPGVGPLMAHATALHVGNTTAFAQGTVVDEQDQLIAVATGSFNVQRARPPRASRRS